MKMRRESLSQIMILRRKLGPQSNHHKMVLRDRNSAPNSPCMFSPKKKRPLSFLGDDSTPSKMRKTIVSPMTQLTPDPKTLPRWVTPKTLA